MPIVPNRFYNAQNSIGAGIANLASLFAPPEPQDLAAYAAAKLANEKASRLAELYSSASGPNFDQTVFDRRNVAVGNYAPTSSYYAQDQNDATARYKTEVEAAVSRENNRLDYDATIYGHDSTARTSLANNRLDNTRAALGNLYQPLQPGDVRAELPAEYAAVLGLPGGAVPAIAGAPKPLTETEVKGAALLGLPHQQLLDTVYGGDVETVTGADGKPVVVSRRDAIGKPAYIKPDAGAKPTLGVAEYPDGRSVPAQVGSDGVWRNTQTGEALPLGFTVFDLPKATGSKSDVGMAGLTTSAASEAQRKAMTIDTAIASGKDLLKQLGDTPGSLGIAGWSRRTIQDLVQTGNELAQAYQGQIADTIARAEKAGTDAGLLSEKFDPKLPAIQAAMNMFIWNMAAANSGDRVSNEQFNRLQQALGLDGAFANTASASAKIAEAIRIMEQQRGYLDETLNAGTVQPPGATGGPKPGEVIDGYRFKGGDPSVPANWEQVK